MTKMRPIHSGEILGEEFLVPLGLSASALAPELKGSCAAHQRYRARTPVRDTGYGASALAVLRDQPGVLAAAATLQLQTPTFALAGDYDSLLRIAVG